MHTGTLAYLVTPHRTPRTILDRAKLDLHRVRVASINEKFSRSTYAATDCEEFSSRVRISGIFRGRRSVEYEWKTHGGWNVQRAHMWNL